MVSEFSFGYLKFKFYKFWLGHGVNFIFWIFWAKKPKRKSPILQGGLKSKNARKQISFKIQFYRGVQIVPLIISLRPNLHIQIKLFRLTIPDIFRWLHPPFRCMTLLRIYPVSILDVLTSSTAMVGEGDFNTVGKLPVILCFRGVAPFERLSIDKLPLLQECYTIWEIQKQLWQS